jgi:hypothetical protein
MSSVIRSFSVKPAVKKHVKQFDLSSIRYNTPIRQDMVVLLAFFNPAHSFRIVQNVYTVKQLLELAHIPVYIGEVAYKDEPFALEPSQTTYQYRTNSIMFYKENIMAQLIDKLPDTFTKIVLLDADILFVDPDWYRKISDALDTCTVVQPFFRAFQLDMSFHLGNTKHSIFSDENNTHQGYVWAFQRSWLREYPLFEHSLIGGGDTVLYNNVINYRTARDEHRMLCDYVNIDILHLPHGTLQNRQYGSRHTMIQQMLSRHKLATISDAVDRTSDGIFEWNPSYRSDMNEVLLTYFQNRDDDGI